MGLWPAKEDESHWVTFIGGARSNPSRDRKGSDGGGVTIA